MEQTLLEGGRGHAVTTQRMQFQELMRDRFYGVIERATSRSVVSFMVRLVQDPGTAPCRHIASGASDCEISDRRLASG